MFKNRFIFILAALSILMATIAVSRPFSSTPDSVDLSWPPRLVIPPVTSANEFPDYYQRHPGLRVSTGIVLDTTDYFIRHPELRISVKLVDLTDYHSRHPELSNK
jgi:hypothetical protein